jgi:hypothetical protein
MFQLQGANISSLYVQNDLYLVFGVRLESQMFTLHQKPDKDPFLYRGLMMAPFS